MKHESKPAPRSITSLWLGRVAGAAQDDDVERVSWGRRSAAALPVGGTPLSFAVLLAGLLTPCCARAIIIPLQITSQPQSQTVGIGGFVAFSVTATGSPPVRYQWRKGSSNLVDGTRITGVTNSTLNIFSVQATDAGTYSVRVDDQYAYTFSTGATLTVLVPPVVQISGVSTAAVTVTLYGTPGNQVALEGALDVAGPYSALTNVTLNAGGRLDYTQAVVSLTRRFFRAHDLGGVYSPNVVGMMNLVLPPGFTMGSNPFMQSNSTAAALLPWVADGITLYLPGASGYQANSFVSRWAQPSMLLRPGDGFWARNPYSTSRTLTFAGEIPNGRLTNVIPTGWSIGSSIFPKTGRLGADLGFPPAPGAVVLIYRPAVGGYDSYSYDEYFMEWVPEEPVVNVGQPLWILNSLPIPISWAQIAGSGIGYVRVGVASASSAAQVNFCTFNTNAGLGRVLDADGGTLLSGPAFQGRLYATTNADGSGLTAVGAAVPFLSGNGAGFLNAGEVSIPFAFGGQTVYLQLRVWNGGAGSTYETAFAAGARNGRSALFPVTAGSGLQGGGPGGLPPEVNQFSSFSLSVPPGIVTPPRSQTVAVGGTARFSVQATGTPPLAYQWRKDGVALPASNHWEFQLDNVQLPDAGGYTVVITGSAGSMTSQVALLTVRTWPVALWINECMTTNAGFLLDPVDGAPDPWFEIFNPEAISVDLSGWSLSDVATNRFRFRVPTNSSFVLPPGGFLVGWADGQPDQNFQGGLHTSFRLGSAAGFLGLYAPDGSAVDTVLLAPQAPDLSQGRYPDGGAGLLLMDFPTPGWPNYLDYLPAAPPAILAQPRNKDALVGNDVTFQVVAAGEGILTYQWRRDGTNLLGAISPTLMLPKVTAADGADYAVVVANSYGVVTSAVARLTVLGSLTFRVDGESYPGHAALVLNAGQIEIQTTIPGGIVFYSVDGLDPGFGALYEGPFLLSYSSVIRAVVYTPGLSQWAETEPFSLTVIEAPVIVRQPASRTVAAGSVARLEVVATGTPPLSYRWRRNGLLLPFADGPALVLSNVQPAQAGAYSVVVTNAAGSDSSFDAILSVWQPPSLSQLPAVTQVQAGSTVVLVAEAAGDPPFAYQWRRNGVNMPGQTNATLVLSNVAPEQAGGFSVVVANGVGVASSQPSTVLVDVPSLAFAVDDFASPRPAVSNFSGYVTGENSLATREPGEPYHAGKFGSNSVWFSWRAPWSGIATFRTAGSSFDTLLAVYRGSVLDSLVPVASDEDRGGYLNCQVQFNATAGELLHIALDGFAGQRGPFVVGWSLETNGQTLPVITNAPVSQTVRQGADVTLRVGAAGPLLRYQWYFNGQRLDGAESSVLRITNLQPVSVGDYTVVVSNLGGRSVESPAAAIEIGPVASVQSQDKPEDLLFHLRSGPPGFAGKDAAQFGLPFAASIIQVAAGSVDHQVVNNSGSTTASGETHCGVVSRATQWLLLVPGDNGTMVIDTLGSFDASGQPLSTVLAVYAGDDAGVAPVPVACGVANAADLSASRVEFAAVAGAYYYVAMDALNNTQGTIQVHWALGTVPVLLNVPAEVVVKRGGRLRLAAAINTAVPPATFQWLLDEHLVADGASSVLTIGDFQQQHAGSYRLALSNAIGSVTGLVATAVLDPHLVAVVESAFDDGDEGWIVSSGASGPAHGATDGHPFGCVLAQDQVPGSEWFWMAPDRFLGNQWVAYGGWLEFDLRLSSLPGLPAGTNVVLIGGGLTLVCTNTLVPRTDWRHFKVSLDEREGWVHPSGEVPSRAEMVRVLGSLTSLQIRGSYSGVRETGFLDNVALVVACTNAPCTNTAPVLAIYYLTESRVGLEWPDNALCLEVVSTNDVAAVNWASQAVVPGSDRPGCLNRATVEVTDRTRFFRLRTP